MSIRFYILTGSLQLNLLFSAFKGVTKISFYILKTD